LVGLEVGGQKIEQFGVGREIAVVIVFHGMNDAASQEPRPGAIGERPREIRMVDDALAEQGPPAKSRLATLAFGNGRDVFLALFEGRLGKLIGERQFRPRLVDHFRLEDGFEADVPFRLLTGNT
jgi:hypothetical protein